MIGYSYSWSSTAWLAWYEPYLYAVDQADFIVRYPAFSDLSRNWILSPALVHISPSKMSTVAEIIFFSQKQDVDLVDVYNNPGSAAKLFLSLTEKVKSQEGLVKQYWVSESPSPDSGFVFYSKFLAAIRDVRLKILGFFVGSLVCLSFLPVEGREGGWADEILVWASKAARDGFGGSKAWATMKLGMGDLMEFGRDSPITRVSRILLGYRGR